MNYNGKNNPDIFFFYKDQIENDFFRFWNKAVDRSRGGIFTCFNNYGTDLLSRNKYTWSQGRFVWLWSKLYGLSRRGILSLDSDSLFKDLQKTTRFLEEHFYLPNGNCVYVTDEKGNWLESSPGKGYDTSFYADCFIALGFSEYARISGDRHYAGLALNTYRQIRKRLKEANLRSEPYPIPEGYKYHSVTMIMLSVTEELALTLELSGDERSEEIDADACGYMQEIMEVFYNDEENRINEVIGPGGAILDNVLCRHVNPGHAIEDLWFVMELARRKDRRDYIERAAAAVKSEIELGWDSEFGGLFRFVDASGGKPAGHRTGDLYERLILDTWDTKLWWPHAEMLYATLMSYHLTNDMEFVSLYNRVHDYVFRTFPNEDRSVGEWIQIRDRKGKPAEKVVALPVKDPYHIMRSMILIVEMLA